jgi:hypothetical protein
MSLRLKCPGCGQTLEAPLGLAGKKAKCQNCGAVVEIPPSSASVPPQQIADPPKQPASSSPPQASPAVFGSPPQGASPLVRITLDRGVFPITVDHRHKAKRAFGTGFRVALACLAAGAVFFVGGCIFIAILAASASKKTDTAIEDSTTSLGELDFGMQSDQGFEFKNAKTRKDFGILKVLVEVTNNSGRSYPIANFVITLYDKDGKLLDSGHATVSNLTDGATKSFEAPVIGVWGDEIGRCKIQFENGM